MVYLQIVWFLLIIYLLYSNWLQKIKTTRAIEIVNKFESKINNSFESVIKHVGTIKSAIQAMQLGAIGVNLEEGLNSPGIKVEKISAEDPQDKIVSLGDLIPPE